MAVSYIKNDVYQSVGPAPAGENAKRKQLEYDGLGRLSSVCEITSASGSGTCNQTNAVTGYWTKYTYDALGNLTGVTQNAQGTSQTRTYAYDELSRMTSEMNPENGTTTYTYDSDTTCGTSKGDLVKRVDAVGNVTCYHYDALHRITYISYPSGSYASVTPSKYYVYDSATVDGTAMANPKNRLVEAYTCVSCSPLTKVTDLGFSYSVRGEVTDSYEWTTNSGGWYHVSGLYWPNGGLNQLSTNLSGLPTITYGADGEGRVSTVGASSGQNPVTGTSYNYAGQVTSVTLGSGDSDQYTYDSSTDRMTKYQFTIGTTPQNVIGNLGWNPNGSLGSLGITDPFNAANDQTCSYAHDDLSRIASANCGSIWTQSFAFDPFGNINKTGTQSFTPTYSTSTNQVNGGGYSQSYDANGNLLTINDGTNHTYSWDTEGKQIGIDTVTATYDAFGRMVEVNNSGTYTQTVYGLSSQKLALMNGQTIQKSFVALPSGTAVYTSSGLAYYRHSDWLGSSRFASSTSRTMYSSSAYAPYGEPYAKAGTNDLNFTGQQQDTISGLYDFMFRRLSQIQGRWISPDPGGLSVVNPANPQTWNRYAYVSNNPMRFTDAYGLQMGYTCPQDQTGEDGTGCEGGGGGGGGGSADCSAEFSDCSGFYLDGLQTSASTVEMLLSAGWAARCPNGDCEGAVGGVLAYYSAYLTGGTYAPYAGPGSRFDTNDQAMTAGSLYAENQSLLNNGYERCGFTYATGNQYSYADAVPGTATDCTIGSDATYYKVPSENRVDIAGAYHSHGLSGGDRLSEISDFQPGHSSDQSWSNGWTLPISVATPGGNLIIYYPQSGCETFILGGPTSGTTIPTCH